MCSVLVDSKPNLEAYAILAKIESAEEATCASVVMRQGMSITQRTRMDNALSEL